jgi:PhzF family phenazine biosynthesis protein
MKLFIADAFTSTPFKGNPAAVCLVEDRVLDDAQMQAIAREMNLSETAFVAPRDDGSFGLRWFTPLAEVALCGHATLASAFVLWTEKVIAPYEIAQFHTQSGLLSALREDDGWITLDFPAKEVTAAPEWRVEIERVLGIETVFVGRNDFDFVVEVESEKVVRELKPNFNALLELPVRGVAVTSMATTTGFHFVSRFFAPRVGINEDPVTGSAHCALAPYWCGRLNKTEFAALQLSARGGVLQLELHAKRVRISGECVLVLRGELNLGLE